MAASAGISPSGLVNLGLFDLVVGDLDQSADLLPELLRPDRTTDDKLPVQYGLLGLAHVAAMRGMRHAPRTCAERPRPSARRRASSFRRSPAR